VKPKHIASQGQKIADNKSYVCCVNNSDINVQHQKHDRVQVVPVSAIIVISFRLVLFLHLTQTSQVVVDTVSYWQVKRSYTRSA
jgi:hypothetical protein